MPDGDLGPADPPGSDQVMSGLFRRDTVYMFLWGLQLAGAALVTPIATRLLGPSQFGVVALSNALMQLCFTVLAMGLAFAIPRAHPGAGGPRVARTLVTASVLAASVGSLVIETVGTPWFSTIGPDAPASPLRLSILWAGSSAVTSVCLVLLKCEDRLLQFALVSLFQSVVAEVASLALLVAVRPTAQMFVTGQLVAQLLALSIALWHARPVRIRRGDLSALRDGLAYGLPLVPSGLAALLLSLSDRFVLEHAFGAVEVARYQVAANIGTIPILLLGVLNTAWIPRMFTVSDPASRGRVLADSRDLLSGILMPISLGMAAGAPFVLLIWAPASFRPHELVLVTATMALGAFPTSIASATHRSLLLAGDTVAASAIAIAGVVTNIALNLALAPAFGLLGAATAAVATQVLLQAALRLRSRGVAPLSPTPVPLLSRILLVMVLCLGAALLPSQGWMLLVRAAGVVVAGAWLASLAWRASRPRVPSGV